jgi:hypothetical protein
MLRRCTGVGNCAICSAEYAGAGGGRVGSPVRGRNSLGVCGAITTEIGDTSPGDAVRDGGRNAIGVLGNRKSAVEST